MVLTAVPTNCPQCQKLCQKFNPRKDNDQTHVTARKHDVIRNIHDTIVDWNEMKWKCGDLKCVQKPTRGRLSLTHLPVQPLVRLVFRPVLSKTVNRSPRIYTNTLKFPRLWVFCLPYFTHDAHCAILNFHWTPLQVMLMTIVTNPEVGCHITFRQTRSDSDRATMHSRPWPVPKLYCLVTEAQLWITSPRLLRNDASSREDSFQALLDHLQVSPSNRTRVHPAAVCSCHS